MLALMARSLLLPTEAPPGDGVVLAPDGGISVTYVGHATVLVRFDGVTFLTDPVYSSRLIVPKRLVAPGVPLDRLPPLDVVLVSHGHMDHLDVPTHHRLPKHDTVAVVGEEPDRPGREGGLSRHRRARLGRARRARRRAPSRPSR
jgi:L-ascorbate metabolism protein UlaG (beta-lactamase superfamily)